jgi:hypothetical protein
MHDLGYSTEQLITPMSNMWLANSEITEYSLGQNSDGMHLREVKKELDLRSSRWQPRISSLTIFLPAGGYRNVSDFSELFKNDSEDNAVLP